ncbi:large-conductance mechanosensitive channel protein MscL [Mycolicibacterium phlei]|uniref:large-conductance mechanosensitive channel protein MscL n=1 Tax=Mycolicibacterium phlei TaxID=1771 RepID=UPI000777C908|nr:large-conductance mechanosensitive channel protein MscL [Mycolicibacterium phlei]KXW61166.1 large conductance mechanosensitive channel protein MscL [Mycolicibacterium phlei DSM 43239 = CCUG 21000]
MLKGFKDFLARGNIIDLSVAVVIGTAFTGLVTSFTDAIIQPLIDRIGAGGDADYGVLRVGIGGGQTIDFNVLLSAAINFLLVAAVVYFLIVAPYNRLRRKGEVEQAQDTELSLLTEIRNILAENKSLLPEIRTIRAENTGSAGAHAAGPGTGPSPDTAKHTSADRD